MNGTTDVTTGGASSRPDAAAITLTAGVLLVMMLGGTLPIPLYVLYEKQMGFGPLGVTIVFAAYCGRDAVRAGGPGGPERHIGRRKVLVTAVACAASAPACTWRPHGIGC